MNFLELKTVSKSYRNHFWSRAVPALQDLSFVVPQKGITGFVGPNGAGKTTSIKILLGLLTPTAGSAYIRGVPSHLPEARRNVAYVSEQPYFYHHLTARESLTFAYRLNRYPPDKLTAEIDRVLQTVQLTAIGDKKIHTLSKGMQQRLNMAHALLGNPSIYILDEPMSGLDPLGRRLFRDLFLDLAAKDKCLFFSTHIIEDIERLCKYVIALDKGAMVYAGSLDELLARNTAGAEIHVDAIPENIIGRLHERGYTVTTVDPDNRIIHVPTDKEAQVCQKLLYEHNIFPKTISRRTASLESILYKSAEVRRP